MGIGAELGLEYEETWWFIEIVAPTTATIERPAQTRMKNLLVCCVLFCLCSICLYAYASALKFDLMGGPPRLSARSFSLPVLSCYTYEQYYYIII